MFVETGVTGSNQLCVNVFLFDMNMLSLIQMQSRFCYQICLHREASQKQTQSPFFLLINCIYFIVLLQSLDYDNIENQLFLEEERRMSYMVNRVGMTWVYVLPSECFAVLEFVCFLHVILYLLGFPLSGDQSLGRLRSNRLPDRPHRLFYRHRCGRNCWDQIPSGQREYPEDLCIVHIDIDIEIYIVHICICILPFSATLYIYNIISLAAYSKISTSNKWWCSIMNCDTYWSHWKILLTRKPIDQTSLKSILVARFSSLNLTNMCCKWISHVP